MTELRAGPLRCELRPELGGAIAGLWLDDRPVLRSLPAAQLASARQAAGYPVVPYSNRIGQAAIVWQGTQQPQVRHPGDAPQAIHGLGWLRPWELLDQDETSAMLAFEHRADASWPFAFDCSHTLRLQPSGLELALAVTNQSREPAPMGLGWRLAFPRQPGTRIAFRATGRWELDAEQHPLRRHADAGLDADAASLDLDRCFDGWDGVAEVRAAALRVRVSSSLTRLVVSAGAGTDTLTLAPVSHVPNAVHRYATGVPAADLGLALLQPGESLIAQLRIEAEALA